jgi:hypothetical protein
MATPSPVLDASVYPIPCTDHLLITLNTATEGVIKIHLLDVSGHVIADLTSARSGDRMNLDTRSLALGNYWIQITGSSTVLSRPFTKF